MSARPVASTLVQRKTRSGRDKDGETNAVRGNARFGAHVEEKSVISREVWVELTPFESLQHGSLR